MFHLTSLRSKLLRSHCMIKLVPFYLINDELQVVFIVVPCILIKSKFLFTNKRTFY